jgi:hypothetical protein
MFREEDVIVDLERIIDVCRNGPSTDQADSQSLSLLFANGRTRPTRLLFCILFRHRIPPQNTTTATTDTTMMAMCVPLTFPPAEIKDAGVGEDEGSIFGSLVEGALSFGRTVVVPKPLEFDEFEGFWLAHVFGQYICMNVFQCT